MDIRRNLRIESCRGSYEQRWHESKLRNFCRSRNQKTLNGRLILIFNLVWIRIRKTTLFWLCNLMTSPWKPSIDKFEGCTFNINIFCGDQSTIAKLNETWSLSDRGRNRHYLHCSCTFGHFSYIVVSTTSFFIEPVWKILSSFIDEVCTKLDFEQLFLSRLDWRPVTEESQLNAWARAGKEIKLFMFLLLAFLFG